MFATGPLFIGVKGTVVAIDRMTGKTLWSTHLKGGDFVTIAIREGELFAATKGRVFRLDPVTGDIRWSNELPGLGYGIVSIADAPTGPAAESQRRAAAAAAPGGA